MKRFTIIFTVLFVALQVCGQERRKFNPEKFEAELEQFIVAEAGLSPQESSVFFPIYKEMQQKQRMLFYKIKRYRHIDTSDDKACLDAIKKRDDLEIQMKKLQQHYHLKFVKVIPPGKVMRVIRAEDKFHRQAFRRMAKRDK